MDSYVGRQFGDYRVLELIGSGGMGAVYRAEHVRLRTSVAVKILPERFAGSDGFAARFQREARVMAALHHAGIVRVHHLGEADGVSFLAMDYVAGPEGKPLNLHRYLRSQPGGRVGQEKLRAWAMQMAEALAYAHRRGVVHRDIKPANILIDSDWRVRITDFGLAKVIGEDFMSSRPCRGEVMADGADGDGAGESLGGETVAVPSDEIDGSLGGATVAADGAPAAERSGGVVGTYDYMAPEQRGEGGSVDGRTDIYALGVLLYQALTGSRPVGFARAPSQAVPGLWRQWDHITQKCLEKEQARRYQTAEELLADLQKAGGRASVPMVNWRVGSLAKWGVAAVWLVVLVAAIAVLAYTQERRVSKPREAPGHTIGTDNPMEVGELPPEEMNAAEVGRLIVIGGEGRSMVSREYAEDEAFRAAANGVLDDIVAAGEARGGDSEALIREAVLQRAAGWVKNGETSVTSDADGGYSAAFRGQLPEARVRVLWRRTAFLAANQRPGVVLSVEKAEGSNTDGGPIVKGMLGELLGSAGAGIFESQSGVPGPATYRMRATVMCNVDSKSARGIDFAVATVELNAEIIHLASNEIVATARARKDSGDATGAARKAVDEVWPPMRARLFRHWMKEGVRSDEAVTVELNGADAAGAEAIAAELGKLWDVSSVDIDDAGSRMALLVAARLSAAELARALESCVSRKMSARTEGSRTVVVNVAE